MSLWCHNYIVVTIDYLLNNATLTQGVYSSSCGHGMHMECWRRFHDSRVTELRQSDLLFQRRTAVNYEAGEFLCPLCQYYCNTILPIHSDPLNQRYVHFMCMVVASLFVCICCVCVSVSVCVFLCVYVYNIIDMYIHSFIHIYVHTYVYIYIWYINVVLFALNRPASVDTADDTTFEQWRTRLHELLEYALTQTTAASGSSNSSVRAPAGSSVPSRLAELLPKYLKLEKPSNNSYGRSSSTSSQGVGTASSYSQAVFTVSIKYYVMIWRRLRLCEIFLSTHAFP